MYNRNSWALAEQAGVSLKVGRGPNAGVEREPNSEVLAEIIIDMLGATDADDARLISWRMVQLGHLIRLGRQSNSGATAKWWSDSGKV